MVSVMALMVVLVAEGEVAGTAAAVVLDSGVTVWL